MTNHHKVGNGAIKRRPDEITRRDGCEATPVRTRQPVLSHSLTER